MALSRFSSVCGKAGKSFHPRGVHLLRTESPKMASLASFTVRAPLLHSVLRERYLWSTSGALLVAPCLFQQKVVPRIWHSLEKSRLKTVPCPVRVQLVKRAVFLVLEIIDWDCFPAAEVAGRLMALIQVTFQLHCQAQLTVDMCTL